MSKRGVESELNVRLRSRRMPFPSASNSEFHGPTHLPTMPPSLVGSWQRGGWVKARVSSPIQLPFKRRSDNLARSPTRHSPRLFAASSDARPRGCSENGGLDSVPARRARVQTSRDPAPNAGASTHPPWYEPEQNPAKILQQFKAHFHHNRSSMYNPVPEFKFVTADRSTISGIPANTGMPVSLTEYFR